jgi:hypothetical protein
MANLCRKAAAVGVRERRFLFKAQSRAIDATIVEPIDWSIG